MMLINIMLLIFESPVKIDLFNDAIAIMFSF